MRLNGVDKGEQLVLELRLLLLDNRRFSSRAAIVSRSACVPYMTEKSSWPCRSSSSWYAFGCFTLGPYMISSLTRFTEHLPKFSFESKSAS